MQDEQIAIAPPTIQVIRADGGKRPKQGTHTKGVMGIYACGELKNAMGINLVQLPGWDGSLGIFPCEWEGLDCTLYVWAKEEKILYSGGTVWFYRGLVVLNSDEAAIAYASKCFSEKVQAL